MADGFLSSFWRALFNPTPDPVNNPYAKAMKPEDLIVERVMTLIEKNFDDFRLYDNQNGVFSDFMEEWDSRFSGPGFAKAEFRSSSRFLMSKKHNIFLVYRFENQYSTGEYLDFALNGVALHPSDGNRIRSCYVRIKREIEQAEMAARRAKQEMLENELKWNLAEQLCGMRRTAEGALVPKNNHPNCCSPYVVECECTCDACLEKTTTEKESIHGTSGVR